MNKCYVCGSRTKKVYLKSVFEKRRRADKCGTCGRIELRKELKK